MKKVLYGVAALLAASGVASAQNWAEVNSGGTNGDPDAGEMLATANITLGDGPLSTITGSLVNTPDADLYQICITDPQAFSAVVPGNAFSGGDTNLSLFAVDGTALAFNNDDPMGGVGSALSGALVPSAGIYYLGISRNDTSIGYLNIPTDSMGTPLFDSMPSDVELGPTNPGSLLGGWAPFPGGFQLFNYNYTITLTGAKFAAVPAPGAGMLAGLGGLVLLRRRR